MDIPRGHVDGDRLAAIIAKDQAAMDAEPAKVKPTFKERVTIVRGVVARVRAGGCPYTLLKKAGMTTAYARVCRQCAAGEGPALETARKGETSCGEDCRRYELAFARWYLGLRPPANWKDDPDNAALRAELPDDNAALATITKKVGLHRLTLVQFKKGRYGLRAATRALVRAALESNKV